MGWGILILDGEINEIEKRSHLGVQQIAKREVTDRGGRMSAVRLVHSEENRAPKTGKKGCQVDSDIGT
jgi:hypothetical protein